MDPDPPYGGSDLGKIRHGRGGPLCIAGVDPMPPLVLPHSPCLSGDRCASAPLAGHEAVCFTSGQAHANGAAQGEDMWTPPSPSSPVLTFQDVVLRVNLPPGGRPVGDSGPEGPTLSASGQDLAPTSRDLEVVVMADHWPPLALDLSDGVRETIDSARALSTRKLYSSKWRVFESWCLANAVDPVNCPVGSVLEFLQHKFSAGEASTTLRVYVVAIAARRDSNDVPLGTSFEDTYTGYIHWRGSIWASDNRSHLGVPTAVSYCSKSGSLIRKQGLRKWPEMFYGV